MDSGQKKAIINEHLIVNESKMILISKAPQTKRNFPRPVSYKKIFARLFHYEEELPDTNPNSCLDCGRSLFLGKDKRYYCSNCGLENGDLSIYDDIQAPRFTKTFKEYKQLGQKDIEEYDIGQERNTY